MKIFITILIIINLVGMVPIFNASNNTIFCEEASKKQELIFMHCCESSGNKINGHIFPALHLLNTTSFWCNSDSKWYRNYHMITLAGDQGSCIPWSYSLCACTSQYCKVKEVGAICQSIVQEGVVVVRRVEEQQPPQLTQIKEEIQESSIPAKKTSWHGYHSKFLLWKNIYHQEHPSSGWAVLLLTKLNRPVDMTVTGNVICIGMTVTGNVICIGNHTYLSAIKEELY